MKSAAVRIVSPLLTNGNPLAFEHVERERTTTQAKTSAKLSEVQLKKHWCARAIVKTRRPLFIEVRRATRISIPRSFQGSEACLWNQGKVIALVSGGIDSPVAAWLMMKRGCTIVPLFFDCEPYLDDTGRQRAEAVVRALAVWAGRPLEFAVVHQGPV